MAVGTGTAILGTALAAGTVLSSKEQKDAAKDAARAQEAASAEAAQVQREALESFLERTEPFRQAGESALPGLVEEFTSQPGLPGPEILDNPLLKAIQDDVTRRVFANQAARGRLGSGETPLFLQQALAPTALELGMSLQRQRAQNLFNLAGLGANVASGQGTALQTGAAGIGNALQSAGLARAQGEIGRAQAISQGIGGLANIAGFGLGGGFSPTALLSG